MRSSDRRLALLVALLVVLNFPFLLVLLFSQVEGRFDAPVTFWGWVTVNVVPVVLLLVKDELVAGIELAVITMVAAAKFCAALAELLWHAAGALARGTFTIVVLPLGQALLWIVKAPVLGVLDVGARLAESATRGAVGLRKGIKETVQPDVAGERLLRITTFARPAELQEALVDFVNGFQEIYGEAEPGIGRAVYRAKAICKFFVLVPLNWLGEFSRDTLQRVLTFGVK